MKFQRVYLPMQFPDCPADLQLYGIVRLADNGQPEHTYCCSLTPSVYVDGIGWSTADEAAGEEPAEGGYFSPEDVRRALTGAPFEAEDEDEAREHAHGNW